MNFISRFLEKAKNFIISFFIPLNFNGVVGERIWQASSFSHPQRFVGTKVLFKISFPQEMKFHEISNSQSPFLNQLLSADFKFSFIIPVKPKHFPFLRLEKRFHFLQKLKGQTKVTRLERWKIRHFQIPFCFQFLQWINPFFFRHFE